MDYFQFIFEGITDDKKDVLIALLDNIDFNGFEEDNDNLKAYIAVSKFDEEKFDFFIENNNIRYLRSTVKEINWNEEWEKNFEPVIITHPVLNIPFASVRANFHPTAKDVLYDLVITPKMSFGTGHHATTCLMIQQMSLLDFHNKTVIDFGTGTAILAILAEKMGAPKITAIDNDDSSIENAKENIAANDCKHTEIIKADTMLRGVRADILLININLNIIIANLAAIMMACNSGAVLLFSGILVQDEDQLTFALKENNFFVKSSLSKQNWLIVVAGV